MVVHFAVLAVNKPYGEKLRFAYATLGLEKFILDMRNAGLSFSAIFYQKVLILFYIRREGH